MNRSMAIDQLVQKYIDKKILESTNKLEEKFSYSKSSISAIEKNVIGFTGGRSFNIALHPHPTDQVIISGVIKYSSMYIFVDTQSAAATDDLDTITPLTLAQNGDLLIIAAKNDARTVVVKNGTGNIICNGDFSLDTVSDRMLLQWDAAQKKWIEIARNDDIAISATELGTYTPWTDWTPTVTASGLMTVASTSISIARYMQLGKTVYFQVYITTTTGGTASTALRFTAPVTPGNNADNKVGGGCWVIDTTAVAGLWGWNQGGAYFQCFKYDSSNFGLGAGRAVNVQGFYEVA